MTTASAKNATLDQRRAAHAWETVATVAEAKGAADAKEKFKIHAKKLPARIVTSGLGPALAFLKAKKYAPELLTGLNTWIDKQIPAKDKREIDLLQRVIHGDSDFLRRATEEVLLYLQWLNRFADAEILDEGRSES
ncbi:MAG: hypothetical protein GEEBNDBF_02721 [bacterium]|nr:hypothetical protein [bacterium]